METLRSLRHNERVVILDGSVDDKSKIAYVTVELQNRDGAIIVFANHSDDVVELVLKEIDPHDSGYIFFASELQIDPVKNHMVPTHRLATGEELRYLKDKRVPISKLPVLRMLDPIRRWHNFQQGTIVAIERSNGVYFRIVM
jgi:DNA-directed RNA polymerase subunit H (RpoH/RPB5)